jgi:hypothetical protein
MTAEDRAARHHASAATHHRHAMQFHREASHHYQIGKDYARAAHQALVAHGHTLKAIDHWQQAINDYSERGAYLFPESETQLPHRCTHDRCKAAENCGVPKTPPICGAEGRCDSEGTLILTGSTTVCSHLRPRTAFRSAGR